MPAPRCARRLVPAPLLRAVLVRALAAVLLTLPVALALPGCQVGINFLSAPHPPERHPLPAFEGARVVYDICPAAEIAPKAALAMREPWQDEFPRVLQRDFGIAAQGVWPQDGGRAYYVRVRLPELTTPRGLGLVSGVISALTFSLIPGGYVERHPVLFDLYAGGAGDALQRETLRYEYRLTYLIWLPLIVYPDFLIPGYRDADWQRRLLDPVIQSFVADADARLRAAGAAPVPLAARPALHGCGEPAAGSATAAANSFQDRN
jgi:hypothetical protein